MLKQKEGNKEGEMRRNDHQEEKKKEQDGEETEADVSCDETRPRERERRTKHPTALAQHNKDDSALWEWSRQCVATKTTSDKHTLRYIYTIQMYLRYMYVIRASL